MIVVRVDSWMDRFKNLCKVDDDDDDDELFLWYGWPAKGV